MEELPKEYQNHVKLTDQIENILEIDDAEQDVRNLETLASLEGGMAVGDILLPPPTIGVLMLLETIDSPFISGVEVKGIGLRDILRALYVMVEREHSVSALMRQKQVEKRANDAFDKTAKSDTDLSVYLNYIDRTKHHIDAFEEEVDAFALKVGCVDPQDAIKTINDYLSLCMGGFQMLPQSDSPSKKKD